VVAAGSSPGVERWREKVEEGDVEGPGQTQTDLSGRVDPVQDLTGPGAGHRDDGERRHPGRHHIDHQVGETGESPVFEPVDQLSGHTVVLEGGDQPDPTLQDPLRSRAKIPPATNAEKVTGEAMTGLAEHDGKGMWDRGQKARP
jgi:hypothetical protein